MKKLSVKTQQTSFQGCCRYLTPTLTATGYLVVISEGNCTKFKQEPEEMIKMMKSKDKYLLNKQESDVLETVNDLYGEVDVDGRLLRQLSIQ